MALDNFTFAQLYGILAWKYCLHMASNKKTSDNAPYAEVLHYNVVLRVVASEFYVQRYNCLRSQPLAIGVNDPEMPS